MLKPAESRAETLDASRTMAMLQVAARTRCRVLSWGGIQDIEPSETQGELERLSLRLRDVEGLVYRGGSGAGPKILCSEGAMDLGHAPSWIGTGQVYEELIAKDESGVHVDYVFCLDAWAASIAAMKPEGIQRSKWVYVSDHNSLQNGPHSEYWGQMARWLVGVGFDAIVAKSVWDRVLSDAQGLASPGGRRPSERVHCSVLGAWQWLVYGMLPEREQPRSGCITFLVRSSGSVANFKTLWKSICRQDYDLSKVRVLALVPGHRDELASFLKWAGVAHNEIRTDLINLEESSNSARIDQGPAQDSEFFALLASDRIMLSRGTAQRLARARVSESVPAVTLDLETSAHIITGNLDPVSHFDKLLQAFANTSPRAEAMRVIPRSALDNKGLKLGEQLMNLVTGHSPDSPRMKDSGDHSDPLVLVQLGEIPQ